MLGRRISRGERPGLIGTAARTAVIAGTATAVSNKVASRQMQRHAEQHQQPAAAQAAAPSPEIGAGLDEEAVTQLERLGALHGQGLLTDEEFAAAKRRLLNL